MKKIAMVLLLAGLLSGCVQVVDHRVTPNDLFDVKNREVYADKRTVFDSVQAVLQNASPADAALVADFDAGTITGVIRKRWGYYQVTATVVEPDFKISTVTLDIQIANTGDVLTPYPETIFYVHLLNEIERTARALQ